MEAVLNGAARPVSRKRIADYVVVLRGRVIFEAPTISEAVGFRDGLGAGSIYERVLLRKVVKPC